LPKKILQEDAAASILSPYGTSLQSAFSYLWLSIFIFQKSSLWDMQKILQVLQITL